MIHLSQTGEDYLHDHGNDLKDRTSLFKDQLSSGNCSLSLLVTTAHSGTYHSCVAGRLCCTVTLKVLPAGEEDSSQIILADCYRERLMNFHPKENNHLYDQLKPNMLQCSNTTIEVKAGDRVILSCSTKDKKDISHEEVEWLFKDPTTGEDKSVHVYFQGKDYLQEQSDDFKDRTSLFKDQLSSGNCSLGLLVNTSHSGTYHSCVAGNLCCTVTLKVLPAGGDDSSQKHQDDHVSPDKPNEGTDGQTQNNCTTGCIVGAVVGGVVVVAALISLVVYLHRKHGNPHRSGMKPKNGQVYHGDLVQAHQPPQDEEKKPLDQNPNEEQTPLEVVVHQGH
ncbi:uncharacterized protein AB9X84_015277 [Acanthopagrus schlegelii]